MAAWPAAGSGAGAPRRPCMAALDRSLVDSDATEERPALRTRASDHVPRLDFRAAERTTTVSVSRAPTRSHVAKSRTLIGFTGAGAAPACSARTCRGPRFLLASSLACRQGRRELRRATFGDRDETG